MRPSAAREERWDFPDNENLGQHPTCLRCLDTSPSRCLVEAMGLEPTNLLTASQALYQLSYAPSGGSER